MRNTYRFVKALDKKNSPVGVVDQLISGETHESSHKLVGALIEFHSDTVGALENLFTVQSIKCCLSLVLRLEVHISRARQGIDILERHVGLRLLNFDAQNRSII